MQLDYPCHAKPRAQWCDHDGPGGFMGHTCCDQRVFVRVQQVVEELENATRKHGAMKSGHEAYAVILEELDEFWHEIKHGTKDKARKEAVQVAAMAIRYLVDLG